VVWFVAPSWILRHAYGEIPTGAVSIALARHWGLLLFCVGTLLIYSAFYQPLREAAVVLAAVEKAGFVALFGTSLYRRPMALIMAGGAPGVVSGPLFFILPVFRRLPFLVGGANGTPIERLPKT